MSEQRSLKKKNVRDTLFSTLPLKIIILLDEINVGPIIFCGTYFQNMRPIMI